MPPHSLRVHFLDAMKAGLLVLHLCLAAANGPHSIDEQCPTELEPVP